MSKITFSPVLKEAGLRDVTVLLGSTSPTSLGDGGWSVLARPKNIGFTSWEGFGPRTMVVNVMFDGVVENRSPQADYDALQRIMRKKVGTAKQPSPVRLKGSVVSGSASTLWVIQSIEQDAAGIIRSPGGKLLRAPVVVGLIEYVEADVLITTVPSPAKRINNRVTDSTSPVSARTHTVQVGDTMSKIAAKYLGSWSRYPEIAELNGIRDPNRVPVGTVLKLP